MSEATAGLALARIAEANEARAYRSLFVGAGLYGFDAAVEGGALRLTSAAAPGAMIVNRILGWGLSEGDGEQALDRLIAPFQAASLGFGVELAEPASTVERVGWLKARRLRRITASQVLHREGGTKHPSYASWAQASGLRVEAVDDSFAAELSRLCCENFAVPAALGPLLAGGALGPEWRRWLAFDGERPVGGSLSFVADGVAWFGWTSVSPSHRGRWAHAGIVARQLEDADAAGCRCATTETALSTADKPDPAYYNLRRFGFRDAYLRPTYVWAPPRKPPP